MIPLEHTILYSADSYPSRYWNLPRNTTEWSLFMTELTTAGNAVAKLMLQALSPSLHGAHIGTSVVHITHIYADRFLFRAVRLSRALLGHDRSPSTLPERHCALECHWCH